MAIDRASLRILVVDDDPFQLEFLTEVLATMEVKNVRVAEGGEQALQLLARSGPFDLLLIDLHMPGMDGFQFMEQLGKLGFKGGVILVSGQTTEVLHSAGLVAQLRRFKFLGSVPKPVDKLALGTLIDHLLA